MKRSPLSEWFRMQGFPLLDTIQIDNSFEAAVRIKDLVFVSSATPRGQNGVEICGKVGAGVDTKTAMHAAKLCVAHSLSLLRHNVGEPLEKRIVCVVDLTFFINAIDTFDNHSSVADAGSELLIGALGHRGVHARSAIGVASLVRNVSVVLKAVYRVKALGTKLH